MPTIEKEELIWVSPDMARRYREAKSAENVRAKQLEIFDGYIKKLSDDSKREFKASLDALEEDAIIYTGLMIKVKQAFSKAKDEALSASYALWEEYDKEMPTIHKKVDAIVNTLKPLTEELEKINNLFTKINTYGFDKVMASMKSLSDLDKRGQDILKFIVENYSPERTTK